MNLKIKLNKTESFSRYEFKFLLNKKKADQIEKEIKNFMVIDSNALKNDNKKYFVRSLYFDTPDYANFYEKVDGIKLRKKFRIRSYSDKEKDDTKLFLEMKGRKNQKTYKLRTQILPEHLKLFTNQKDLFQLLKYYSKENKVVNDFVYESLKKKIEPKVVVDYNRRPYVNKFGLLFRLTFDTELKTSSGKDIFDYKKNFSFKECVSGKTILELKFERSIQPWFHRIIQNYNLMRLSVSKFALGMEKNGYGRETSN
jgi:hypothetical protein